MRPKTQHSPESVVELPDKSPRELAWHITDKQGYYISESTVYRILKAHVACPHFVDHLKD